MLGTEEISGLFVDEQKFIQGTRCNQQIMSQIFFGFFSKLARTKTQQSTNKVSEHNIQYSRAYQQVVSTSFFILCPPFILLPHYLRQIPFFHLPPPPTEYAAPLPWVGIRNIDTASYPTSDKALAVAKPLQQPPHLHINGFLKNILRKFRLGLNLLSVLTSMREIFFLILFRR